MSAHEKTSIISTPHNRRQLDVTVSSRPLGNLLGIISFLCMCIFLCVVLMTAVSAKAQSGPPDRIRVEGTVRDSSGGSITSAQVDLKSGAYSAEVSVNSSGGFAFENVPATSGTITVTANGFQKFQQDWNTSTGKSVNIDIVLVPVPLSQQIVVTANRAPTLMSDLPASDIQLTRNDLQATPALTLDDELRQIPGFSLFRRFSSRVANPTTQGVSLRGLGANGASRALVLEDGIPINDPFGAWVYWDRVPAESVASVEISQEGGSSLYGSDALGGVIQFITRPAEPAGISLETSYGNQNTPDLSLSAGGQKGQWESTFAGEAFNTDGYILVPKSFRGTVDTKASSDHGTADLMIGRKIGSQDEIFARGWLLDESRGNGTPLQRNETKLGQGALGANLTLGDFGSLTARFYADVQTYHQSFSAVATNRDSENLTDLQTVPSQGVGGSVLWSRKFGKRQTVVAGFDEHEEIGVSNEMFFSSGMNSFDKSSGGRQRTLGIFGEDLIQITSRWLLTVSARVDYWRNFDASIICSQVNSACTSPNVNFPDRSNDAFSPRMTLLYQINPNISWTASVYRAFRAPTLNELYRSFRQGNVITEANAGLTAEHLTGTDTGINLYGFNRRLELKGTFFFNQIVDPVANVTCQPPPNNDPLCPAPIPNTIIRVRENLGRTTAPGVDFDATIHITRDFQLSTGYQYVDSKVASFPSESSLAGLWVAQVPHNAFTFQARYANPRFILVSVDGRLIGKQYDDDQNKFPLGSYFLMDAMVARNVGKGFQLFAAVENLFNAQYSTAATPVPELGLPIAGRFGMRFQFPNR
jgi:outer membrane receptor protein involved in Fe transport